jgi:hypothetical protein
LKQLLAPLACWVAFASIATAQLSDYLGPGVMTGGAGQIGNRSGEQVDLRYYVDANAVYDNGLQPISTNSEGHLTQVGGLYGVEALLGAYGTHSWKTSLLGLDYRGDFRYYTNGSYYDASDQNLTIGYTYQKSRRLYFDFRGLGGTYSNYLGAVPGDTSANGGSTAVNQAGLLLFDNRTDFLQGFTGMTYMLTARASFTVGGDGFYVHRQSSELIDVAGWDAHGRFQYRVSRFTSIGAEYQRSHYQYPDYFGNSDINSYTAFVAARLGRLWTLSLQGGAYQVNTLGVQQVALSPSVAAVLGVSTTEQRFVANDWLPAARATLTRQFKHAQLNFNYNRTMVPGNGVYLTSRSENGSGSFTYTGINKFTFSINGGYYALSSIGQGIQPYTMITGSTGLTYNLTHALHLVARYDLRQQEIYIAGYRSTSYRATLGLAFSPGTLPLSLW